MPSHLRGPQTPGSGLSRRTLLGGAAGAVLLPLVQLSASAAEHKLSAEEIAGWKQSLFAESPPLVYRASTRPMALFPTGGVGAGNVYVGVGGQLRDRLFFYT